MKRAKSLVRSIVAALAILGASMNLAERSAHASSHTQQGSPRHMRKEDTAGDPADSAVVQALARVRAHLERLQKEYPRDPEEVLGSLSGEGLSKLLLQLEKDILLTGQFIRFLQEGRTGFLDVMGVQQYMALIEALEGIRVHMIELSRLARKKNY